MTNKTIIDGIDVICEFCGKHFKKKKYEYKRSKHHYCSLECYHKSKIKTNEIIIHNDYAEILVDNKSVLIDLDDVYFCKQYHWRISNKGYVSTSVNKKSKHLHRLLMNPLSNETIDHINRNKLDNRKNNLKICSNLINMQNRGINKNNTSGSKGVYINRNGNFVTHCQINKTRKYLGTFETLEEANKILEKYRKDNKIG